MYNPLQNFASPTAQALSDREIQTIQRIMRNIDPYGDDPHGPIPANSAPYNPEFVALLYIRLGHWTMTVNHACYAMAAGNSDQDRLDKAMTVFQAKLAKSATLGRDVQFGDSEMRGYGPERHQNPPLPYHPDPTREYDSASLEDFKFLSQNEIFIFVHHPDSSVRLVQNDLIRFVPKPTPWGIKMPNCAFYDAKDVDLTATGLEAKMIRMRNYVTDGGGNRLPYGMTLEYSMDIKFQVEGGAAGWISMIIDPDTGNGHGYEP